MPLNPEIDLGDLARKVSWYGSPELFQTMTDQGFNEASFGTGDWLYGFKSSSLEKDI